MDMCQSNDDDFMIQYFVTVAETAALGVGGVLCGADPCQMAWTFHS